MKSPLLARLLVLTAALAITVTPGCKRKTQGPITPLPARSGSGSGIDNPRPSGPVDPSAGGTNPRVGPGDRLNTGGNTGATDLAGNNPNASGTALKTPDPNENLAQSDGPLDRSKYTENRSQFASDVTYFDFDSAVVKTSEKAKMAAVADYLKSNPTAAVEVEGHCDERGTEEYNRSLGERRALAIREELAQKGIDPKRVFTISYGEDRPAVNGHDEPAWIKNRRGEFVLLTPH